MKAARKAVWFKWSGRSASAASVERYRELGYAKMPLKGIHTHTSTVCEDGVASLRFGRLRLGTLLASAISYATRGERSAYTEVYERQK